ncbi:MAG: type pilus biosis protein PilE [Acidobacteria bacterium]|nr:type pilus biosis protein PilE [Acidobacteriota bacterium]
MAFTVRTRPLQETGFTLIELMMVVAIVAILASIALPSYNDYILRGKITEATATLADLRVKLEQYYQDNRNYGATPPACGVAMPALKHFTYTCTTAGQTFTLTATGRTDDGMGDFVYTLTESNSRATTGTKWGTTSTNCWLIRKDGSCA